MNNLVVHEIPIQQFTWDRRLRQLTAFASDLPKIWMKQVWNDSCDVGFKVRGEFRTKLFTLVKEETRDDEVVAWFLKEYSRWPEPGLWVATVFND